MVRICKVYYAKHILQNFSLRGMKMKTTIKSFRMSQDVQDKLDADAKNANMTKTEYLNHLIVYAEKPISTHKKAATYLCRLVNSIQQLTIEPERKEALLEEVRPLWQIL